MLNDAQSGFVCTNRSQLTFGTHGVFIGEVVEVFSAAEVDPLIYVDGRYGRVALEAL